MAYQETKTTGYGTRVGRSFKGIGAGFLMFIGATALLWWNEGRAVKTAEMLDEAEKACIEMPNPNKIDKSLEGELVCGTAMAQTTDSLIDNQYGIGVTAIGLQRKVEYFQWVENEETKTEEKLGGKEVETTTYTYTQEWVNSPVQSQDFKDPAYQNKNMTLCVVEPQELWAENVSFGAYKLNESLIQRISSIEPMQLNLSTDMMNQLEKSTKEVYERTYGKTISDAVKNEAKKDTSKNVVADSSAVTFPNYEYVHINGNELYYGRTPAAPQVGDVKVTFEKITPAKVTIIAQVTGDTFKAYKAKKGKRFQTLSMGKKDADEIFDASHTSNSFWLWVIRIIGVMLVIAGLKGIFGFIEALLKVVPFVANIIGWGVGAICTVIGIVWSLLVIAVAWLFYRPILAIILIIIAAFLVWVFAFKGKEKLKSMVENKQVDLVSNQENK